MAPPAAPDTSGKLQPADLLRSGPELLQAGAVTVAFSGGLDSTVLLHLLASLRRQGMLRVPLRALHINHALQASAAEWQAHCHRVCADWELPCHSELVRVQLAAGDSPEEAARKARHAAFASLLGSGELLVLAQHQDDQVETALFRLLRGSGVAGLAGMPRLRNCGRGLLLRPLLDLPRSALQVYAREQRLSWIEDPSNCDQRYDRNYLRRTILPALASRWPGLVASISRSASLSGEAAGLLKVLANQDLLPARSDFPNWLECTSLHGLDPARQRNLLYCWLQELHEQQGCAPPNHQVLEALVTTVLPASASANPLLSWGRNGQRTTLRRYRDRLYVLPSLPSHPVPQEWQTDQDCVLPGPLGTLVLEPVAGPGLRRDRVERLQLRWRQGGEQVKAAGRRTRHLKKLLQDCGVPPWLREHVPLLYAGDELVAVADLAICEGWLDKTGQNCYRISWQRARAHCGW